MSDYLLDGATREIERLNKIARQFEDQIARLTRENDELRSVVFQAHTFISVHDEKAQKLGNQTVAELTGFNMLPMLTEALANAEKEPGG